MSFPGHSLTLIVKATLDLHPAHAAELAEDQLYPTGDEYEAGDEERQGSPRYPSDFAWYKPRADLLLIGSCHAPGGAPVPACEVAFRVGDLRRALRVTGDRRWEEAHDGSWVPSAPEPFTEMPLRYERAFGGPGFDANPAGKGFSVIETPDGPRVLHLPNTEDPEALVSDPEDRPPPAGFGPLGQFWEERCQKLGSYGGDYLKKRWPWFAEDFDWAHFNAAPPALQREGYLRGDEQLVFENLHPAHPVYESALPGLRVRCFLNRAEADGGERFDEIEMRLDTLWVDMEAERLVLVWRGWSEVASSDYEEVEHAYVVSEPLAEEPKPVEHYRERFWEGLKGKKAGLVGAAAAPPGPEPPPEAEAGAAAAAAASAPMDEEFHQFLEQARPHLERAGIDPTELEGDNPEAVLQKLLDKLKSDLRARGIDPDNPPPLTPAQKQMQAKLMAAAGIPWDAETGMPDLDALTGEDPEALYEKTMAGLKERLAAHGIEPDKPPEVTAAQKAQLKELGIDLDAFQAAMAESEAEAGDGAAGEWEPSREAVRERVARGESMRGADLHELDLSNLDLRGAGLAGAILAGASLGGADLSGADLRGANLQGADLRGARLAGARLEGADLTGANLAGADLSAATLDGVAGEGVVLEGAVLELCTATAANFRGGDLHDTRAHGVRLDQANLSGANLEGANLRGASLRDTRLIGASAARVNLDDADVTGLRASGGANLAGGSFRRAVGPRAMWMDSDLTGADFSWARMARADFTRTTLVCARLHAADMSGARFLKAKLAGAEMTEMNLFEGSLEKADLTRTNLTGSNLFGVEFLEATLSGTRTEQANIKRTKLALEA